MTTSFNFFGRMWKIDSTSTRVITRKQAINTIQALIRKSDGILNAALSTGADTIYINFCDPATSMDEKGHNVAFTFLHDSDRDTWAAKLEEVTQKVNEFLNK